MSEQVSLEAKREHDDESSDVFAALLASMIDDVPGPDTNRLCSEHADVISRSFSDWIDAVEQLRGDFDAYHCRLNHLYVISKLMSDNLGVPLFSQLVAKGRQNTFALWERVLEQGMVAQRELRLAEAASVLSDQLIDTRNLKEFGYRHMAATTHWYVSQAHLHLGRRDEAVEHGERSLRITREIRDHPKYHVRYHEHLLETHRYFGEAGAAAEYAAALAAMFDEFQLADRAVSYRRRERMLRAGEPPVRAVVRIGGSELELGELTPEPLTTDGAKWEILLVRNRMTLLPSLVLTGEGEQLLRDGRVEEALATLGEAAAADRFDPQPLRLAANVLLHGGDFAQAAEMFDAAERRAPGWQQCRHGAWLARQFLTGRHPHELLGVLGFIRSSEGTRQERLRAADRAVCEHPDFAPVRYHHAMLLRDAGHVIDARDTLDVALRSECDDNLRTRLLVELAQLLDRGDARRRSLLKRAVELQGDLAAAAGARLLLMLEQAGKPSEGTLLH